MIDLSSTLLSLGVASFTVTRRPMGYRSDGVYHEAASTTVDVGPASLQPLSRKSIPLPEGVRAEDAKTLLCKGLIRGAGDPDGFLGDRFTHSGDLYEIQAVRDWGACGQGNYYEGLAVRVRDSEASEA